MDIQQKLTGFAMMGATWIMWLLVGLSIGGVAVALERAIYLIRTSENVRKLRVPILGLLRAGDVAGARARLQQSPSHVAGIIAAGLQDPSDGSASAEERMSGALQMAKLRPGRARRRSCRWRACWTAGRELLVARRRLSGARLPFMKRHRGRGIRSPFG